MDFFFEDTKLTDKYELGDLTKTNQVLALPNLPTEQWVLNNLKLLAQDLEVLESQVGPFVIISGFRTEELQNLLKAQGEPTGSGSKSFHEVGRGVDIFPSTMDTNEFFGRLLANPQLRSMFAEIAVKPSQNAIHLAINVPSDVRSPKILGLNPQNQYATLSQQEIEFYVSKYTPQPEQVASEIASSGGGISMKLVGGIAAAAAAITAFLS